VAAFRKARDIDGCTLCWSYEIGEAFDDLHLADSALAAYQTVVTATTGGPAERNFTLAPSLRRLGELSEAKGDKTKAVAYYTRFLDLWREAEPELQPRVAKVKQRVAELVGEPKT
jgi:hypothetical protein